MKPDRWHRVKDFFERARSVPEAERRPLIEIFRRQDPESAEEVESLLAHAAADSSFLAQPVLGERVAARLLHETGPHDSCPPTPARIGQYELVRVIGRGGMGVVYEAQQMQPHRLVAIKIVETIGPVDPGSDRRLQREAQALARLAHPAIAAIYDAGRIEDGRHFFAMELVNGPDLSEFARTRHLDIPQRLRLFCRICEGIHYAHQRGVIHRDLKPKNILIVDENSTNQKINTATESGMVDSSDIPQPKILDFGLARLVEHDVAVPTVVTEAGRVIGTLAYMSPEQARGHPSDVDVRSDVYSLGVILYELLCARCPFAIDTSSDTGFVRSLRRICQDPPRRPSTLNRALRGDLETVILKAMEKDRSLRYQSAAALADDIQRWLTDQPIHARPLTAAYQLHKLIRRYKAIAAMIGVMCVLSLIFAAASTMMSLRIASERDRNSLLLYNSLMAQAQACLDAGKIDGAIASLDQCPPEHRGWEWRWLSSTIDQGEQALTLGGSTRIRAVGFHEGRIWLLSHGDDHRAARLWRSGSSQPCFDLVGHQAPISTFAISRDGRSIATGDQEGVVRLWSAANGESLGKRFFQTKAPITSLKFVADDQFVLACSASGAAGVDSYVWLYHVARNECPFSRSVKSPQIAADVSADARRAAVCINDARIAMFAVDSNASLPALNTQTVPTAVAFMPDGASVVAAFNAPKRVSLIDLESARFFDFVGHQVGVSAVAVSSDGRTIASGDGLGTIMTWNASTQTPLRTIHASPNAIQDIAFSADDRFILTGMGTTEVRLWPVEPPEPWIVSPHDRQPMTALDITRDGRTAVCGSADGAVVLIDIERPPVRRSLGTGGPRVTCVQIAADGAICAIGHEQGGIQVWDVATSQPLKTVSEHAHRIVALAIASDNQSLISADARGGIVVSSLSESTASLHINDQFQTLTAMELSPDDRQIFAADAEGMVGVWDARTGRRGAAWRAHAGDVNALALTPDGSALATAGNDRLIRIWDADSTREIAAWRQDQPALAIAFSPDGKRLVAGGMSPSVDVRNVADGQTLISLGWPGTSVQWTAFDRLGERIIAGSANKGFRIWDPRVATERADVMPRTSDFESTRAPD